MAATISGDDWFAQFRVINAKILGGQKTTIVLHPIGGRCGKRTAIKPVGAVLGNRPIRFGEVRQPQNLPCPFRHALGKKGGARRRKHFQLLRAGGQALRVMTVYGKTMLRNFCGGQQQFFQRKFSVTAQRLIIGRQRAWHTGGQRPSQTQFRLGLAVPHIHVAGCSRGCGLATINGREPAVGQPNQHEAASADAGVLSVHDTEGQSGRHRGINGVASFPESFDCCIGRQRMHRRNHGAPALRQLTARLNQRSAQQRGTKAGEHMTGKGNFHSSSLSMTVRE